MNIQPYQYQRGASLSAKCITFVDAKEKIKPLRDTIILEPLEATLSNIIIVLRECRALKGIVKAVGPGCYPKKYDHTEKHKRKKMWDSTYFRPTEVKIGDEVELGGSESGGYNFDTFYWGDKLHLVAREEDVALING